jgi:hypothetical protein
MNELIGKKINEIWIDKAEQRYIQFKTNEGDVSYYADGDCYSESWFNDIDGVEYLINHTVLQVKEVRVCDRCVIEDSRQEIDEISTIVLVTEAGIVDIVFRNSGDGYYGGSCELVDNNSNSYWKKEIEEMELTQITRDFSADNPSHE